MNLIPYILDLIFPPRETELLLRGAPETILLPFLVPRTAISTTPPTVALLPFREPVVRAAIHEAKYAENPQAHVLLAHALEDYLLEYLSENPDSTIIPIPLSKERFRERGFNQCEKVVRNSRQLAPLLKKDLLVRSRNTEHQTRLSESERKNNIEGAFVAKPLSRKTIYILIDDVITTGATMQAAISALKNAGARHIHPIALSH